MSKCNGRIINVPDPMTDVMPLTTSVIVATKFQMENVDQVYLGPPSKLPQNHCKLLQHP